ncbi:nuclear transport factor 2 family protein [Brevibacillus sp. HB1.1]|uniref:nuclear transport factor 2 family protein n=1 Tax=Brevibacillus sp. HB1.1 TaxID=2738808 RepID=UPI0015753003|nr:nuclear transport factor 2 family protein [Brevibacillus sp. HB1.1]NTU29708.1 nuclear transport factor 2 family protein [Brevibacillus sp. HB1.1]
MSRAPIKNYEEILEVMNKYVEGIATGKSEVMKPSFHKDAIMYGYEPIGLVEGSIQYLYDYVDQAGPAQNLQARVDILDIEGTAACVRVVLESSDGAVYSDFLQLLKINGEWKVIAKLFHRHT